MRNDTIVHRQEQYAYPENHYRNLSWRDLTYQLPHLFDRRDALGEANRHPRLLLSAATSLPPRGSILSRAGNYGR